jgi:hypothetical protein
MGVRTVSLNVGAKPTKRQPRQFFEDCSQPDNVELLKISAERLYQSDALRSHLNMRLSNVASVRSLLDYLDRQARSLVSELEAAQ